MSTAAELYPLRRAWPRQLIVYHSIKDLWYAETDESVLKRLKYLAVSYRQADWEQKELEKYIRTVCVLFLQSNPPAYWLDFACIGQTQKELDYDLYRMADIFKYADETLIVIQDIEDGWRRWGERVWTFPEALLSGRLNYVVPGKNLERHVDLTKIANLAYSRRLWPDEWELLDAYRDHSKDPLTIADRMILGWKAIWNRSIGLATESNIKGYKADKVYALMGLFKNRIAPNHKESEEEALARLLKENHLCGDIMDGINVKTVLTPAYNTKDTLYQGDGYLSKPAWKRIENHDRQSYASSSDHHYSTNPQEGSPYHSNLPALRDENQVYGQTIQIIPETNSLPRVMADATAFTEVLRNSDIDHHGSLSRPSVLLHLLNAGHESDSRIKLDADISDRFLRTLRLDSKGTGNSRPPGRIRSTSSAPESRRGIEDDPASRYIAQPNIIIQPQPLPRPIMTPVTSTRSSTPVYQAVPGPSYNVGLDQPPAFTAPPPHRRPMARSPPPITIIPPAAQRRPSVHETPPIIIQPSYSYRPSPVTIIPPVDPRRPPPVTIIPPAVPRRSPLREAPPIIVQPPNRNRPPSVILIPPTAPRRSPLREASPIPLQPIPSPPRPPPVTIIPPYSNSIPQPALNNTYVRARTPRSGSSTPTQALAPVITVMNGDTRRRHRHRRHRSRSRSSSRSPSLSSHSSRSTNGRSARRSPSPIMPIVRVQSKQTHSRSQSSYEVNVSVRFDTHRHRSRTRRTQHSSSHYQTHRAVPTITIPPPLIESRRGSTSSSSVRLDSPTPVSSTASARTPEVVVIAPRLVLKDSGKFDVARATSPRRLMMREEKSKPWFLCENQDILEEAEYLACSYSPVDFLDQVQLEEEVQTVCDLRKMNAYWVDFACVESTTEEKSRDLYRMCDIFRGANLTVVMIKGGEEELTRSWQVWRDCLWSLPAALLSPKIMVYEVGDELRRSSLEDIRNAAFLDSDAGLRLIDAFLSQASYSVYERVDLLKNALWSYSTSGSYGMPNNVFGEYLAERVYALMGFMQYRISPDPQEDEHTAWDRLMTANRLQIAFATYASNYANEQLPDDYIPHADQNGTIHLPPPHESRYI